MTQAVVWADSEDPLGLLVWHWAVQWNKYR